MAKVQTQLLVNPATKDRADALALVLDESRAEVYRMALEGAGLARLERTHEAALARLDVLADRFQMVGGRSELVRRATEDRWPFALLEGSTVYPEA